MQACKPLVTLMCPCIIIVVVIVIVIVVIVVVIVIVIITVAVVTRRCKDLLCVSQRAFTHRCI